MIEHDLKYSVSVSNGATKIEIHGLQGTGGMEGMVMGLSVGGTGTQ
jgi:hypothetical protein